MTSRERLLAALAHEEPDRIPLDIGSTPVTGIHRIAYQGLRRELGLPDRQPTIWHMMQQLAWVEDDVHAALETDCRGLRPKPPSGWSLTVRPDSDFDLYTDEWGVTRRTQRDRGHYYDLWNPILADATSAADVDRHAWPSPDEDARFDGMRAYAQDVRDQGFPMVLGGICAGMMEMGQALRGHEAFYCDIAERSPIADAIIERVLDLKLAYWTRALELVGDLVDVVQEGDDFGGQHGLLLSPARWRELFRPRLQQLIGLIKERAPHVRVFYHSCGSIYSIIPDLIELGVDVLNPVQVAAAHMDSRLLKREFGDYVTFWGGGVDTQSVLPRGAAAEVRAEVTRRVDDLAPGGGFVFAAIHNIQADVPPANIIEMVRTLRGASS